MMWGQKGGRSLITGNSPGAWILRILIFLFLVIGVIAMVHLTRATRAEAQENPIPPSGGALIMPETDNKSEPLAAHSCEAFALDDMDTYQGEWRVDWTYRTAPEEYNKTTGRSIIEKALAGCGLRETFQSARADRKYQSEWTIVQQESGAREGLWFDTEHAGFLRFDSDETSENTPHVFLWRHPNGRMQIRTTYSVVNEEGFTVERYLTTNTGESWALTNRLRYQRASSKEE